MGQELKSLTLCHLVWPGAVTASPELTKETHGVEILGRESAILSATGIQRIIHKEAPRQFFFQIITPPAG